MSSDFLVCRFLVGLLNESLRFPHPGVRDCYQQAACP
jgi:hypothetical protein